MFFASTRVSFSLYITHIHIPPINTSYPPATSSQQTLSHLISSTKQTFNHLLYMYVGKMVDLDCKGKMVSSDNIPTRSPRPSSSPNKLTVTPPPPPPRVVELSPAPETDCMAYEHYLRLPEIREMWKTLEFPTWRNEPVVKPALQALEFTFRFVSVVLSDPRPYVNRREWSRRLEAVATRQIEVVALICENDDVGAAPVSGGGEGEGVLTRDGSSAEVWRLNDGDDATVVVSQVSEESLLPRLATWKKAEGIAQKIQYSIECEMRRCPYTLGLGEPNLAGKRSLNYDAVCRPAELHSATKSPPEQANVNNHENRTVYTIHQIVESWIYVANELLTRIESEIDSNNFETASSDCFILERVWKLLTEIEDLHLLTDPDDFLRLKNQLDVKTSSESEAFCFRSKALIEITKRSKNLRHKVPYILDVEVDPMGGPRVQEAAMRLYRRKSSGVRIHVLQSLQAVEAAVKRFYYSYKQLLVVAMGSVEANGGLAFVTVDSSDSLAQMFLEPTYYPSLDGAKTFLGDYWSYEGRRR